MAKVSTVVVPKPEFDALVAENARLREANETMRDDYKDTIADLRDENARLRGAKESLCHLIRLWLRDGFEPDEARNALKETT